MKREQAIDRAFGLEPPLPRRALRLAALTAVAIAAASFTIGLMR